jgi:CheY-like chemotaxis protein
MFTILMVDDDTEVLTANKTLLELEGYQVLTTQNGAEAIEMVKKENIDIMLVDYFMPKLTGESLITTIRQFDKKIVIILQTGYAGEKPPLEMLKRLDIQGYHDKTEGPEKLLLWVATGVKIRMQLNELKASYEKNLQIMQTLTEMKQSHRLIETIDSERREYQNNLQVMIIMAALGVTQKLEDYMHQIVANLMKKENGITQINDPILLASIISHQIKAKEYSIPFTVNCRQPLYLGDNISLKIGEIFNLLLDLLQENILAIKRDAPVIIIDIEESQTEYCFDFKTTVATIPDPKEPEQDTDPVPCIMLKLGIAENIIKELNGLFYPIIGEGQIFRLTVMIKKAKK